VGVALRAVCTGPQMSSEDIELLQHLQANGRDVKGVLPASGAANWKRQRAEGSEELISKIEAHNQGLHQTHKVNLPPPAKTDQQKKAERKERNRLSAERHRKKQREYTELLECERLLRPDNSHCLPRWND
jgi:hypothetical protein